MIAALGHWLLLTLAGIGAAMMVTSAACFIAAIFYPHKTIDDEMQWLDDNGEAFRIWSEGKEDAGSE